MIIPEYIKYLFSGLLTVVISRYSFTAVAKSAAGIGVPRNSMATPDAPGVFFFVVAQAHPFSGLWCLCVHRGSSEIMAVRAGQPSGWPVFDGAGILTPVWAIAIERENSGDSNNQLSIGGCHHGYNPHPVIPAICLCVRRNPPCRHSTPYLYAPHCGLR